MDQSTTTETPMLAGLRVIDFTQYVAGPTVTRMMAELGAEIIKVEQVPRGDPARGIPVTRNRRSAYYIQHNRGKQSLCVDYSKPDTIPLLHELIKTADIVVENYGPDVMKKRNLDYFVNMAIADVNAGVHGFASLGYALFHRERSGRGQFIDISMVDALYHFHEANVELCANGKTEFHPNRCGWHSKDLAPYGVFKGPEGWIVILAGGRQWVGLPRAMGQPELIDDPRFADTRSRGKNHRELIDLVEKWMATQESDQAILDALTAQRVPCAPVLSVSDTV